MISTLGWGVGGWEGGSMGIDDRGEGGKIANF